MCIQLYLASDHPLPLIPFVPERSALHVRPAGVLDGAPADVAELLAEAAERARRWLSRPHVYQVGSHLGCGRGFDFREYDAETLNALYAAVEPSAAERLRATIEESDPKLDEFDRACRESSYQLADYLERAVREGDVELLVCWLDEEGDPPKPPRVVTPDYFRGQPDWDGTGLRLDKGDRFVVTAGERRGVASPGDRIGS